MTNRIFPPHRSSTFNRDANVTAVIPYGAVMLLCAFSLTRYVAWIPALVLFFYERDSGFVRFHAAQATLISGALAILILIMKDLFINTLLAAVLAKGAVTVFQGLINIVLGMVNLAAIVICGYLMYQAFRYVEYRLPYAGELADRLAMWRGRTSHNRR